ncbi:cold shock domain-containing protein [Nocardioides sp. 1609]|uniref:cold-shock protein n=1 Tax=Nocardioides sp. 1609 TaxID=2508327 RepID=UPI00106FE8DB|nr:cold shock domain-containing protein [Nocardioides sp. 1609]
MTSRGQVRIWHDGAGWGVIDSDATPGGCWAHFSVVLVGGYRQLTPGQAVTFTFETAEQDGFAFQALEAWPADQDPVRTEATDAGGSGAMRSTLTLTFDDGRQDETDTR